MVKRTCLAIVLFLTLFFMAPIKPQTQLVFSPDLPTYYKATTSSFGVVFKEPYEVLLLHFVYGDNLIITSMAWWVVDVNAAQVEEILKSMGRDFSDVVYIIHNHLMPSRFSVGDINFLRESRRRGFSGRFLLYFPWCNKVFEYDESTRRSKELQAKPLRASDIKGADGKG